MRNVIFGLSIFVGIYLAAFIIIHRSSTLRRPAANLAYWYYSDSTLVEAVEFYGFWPLRQLTYKVAPDFMSWHNDERVYPTLEDLQVTQ